MRLPKTKFPLLLYREPEKRLWKRPYLDQYYVCCGVKTSSRHYQRTTLKLPATTRRDAEKQVEEWYQAQTQSGAIWSVDGSMQALVVHPSLSHLPVLEVEGDSCLLADGKPVVRRRAGEPKGFFFADIMTLFDTDIRFREFRLENCPKCHAPPFVRFTSKHLLMHTGEGCKRHAILSSQDIPLAVKILFWNRVMVRSKFPRSEDITLQTMVDYELLKLPSVREFNLRLQRMEAIEL